MLRTNDVDVNVDVPAMRILVYVLQLATWEELSLTRCLARNASRGYFRSEPTCLHLYIYLYTVRVTNPIEVLTQTFKFYQSSFSDRTARIMEENPFTDIG